MAWPSFPVVQADATAYDLVLLGNSQVAAMGCNSLQNGMNVPSTQHVKWKTCVSKKHGMECSSKFGRNPIFLELVLASGLRSLIGAKTICPQSVHFQLYNCTWGCQWIYFIIGAGTISQLLGIIRNHRILTPISWDINGIKWIYISKK